MTENGAGRPNGPHEIVDQLRQEFVDEAVETLQSLDVALEDARHGRKPEAELVREMRRAAVSLRGGAANFGNRAFATIAHRLDEYLANAPEALPPRAWLELSDFLGLLIRAASGELPVDKELPGLVRGLPSKLGFDIAEIRPRDVEVLLVMPQGAQTKYVERELQQCGYRVCVVPDTIEAFSQVVQTKPDLIIVSALMDHLDGIDLAIALVSMPSTRNIPIAVITSLDPSDERLALLPKKVPVVHKGPSFGDDLFSALDSLFLI